MNEELDSQLSAMFDDELPQAECELLARRLSRDEALKARWRRYAMISAAMRAERGVRMDVRLETNLATRVSTAISAEPALGGAAVARPQAPSSGGFRWWQPVAGGAIAATVAAMSVLWVRSQAPIGSDAVVAQNSGPVAVVAQNENTDAAPPAAYVVPTNVEPRSFMPPAELANYMVAHSEFSTPVSRRNLLSTLVASESGTAGASGESDGAAEVVPVEDPAENVEKAH
ncbi:MAG TPA: RseA family anti-sigma factor [Steroidobacteraceae bacterium]|jgi:negative regulator of sigma E activity|nr:RseA family anti-sigma factor [Steroidobacteraceae bacterium]